MQKKKIMADTMPLIVKQGSVARTIDVPVATQIELKLLLPALRDLPGFSAFALTGLNRGDVHFAFGDSALVSEADVLVYAETGVVGDLQDMELTVVLPEVMATCKLLKVVTADGDEATPVAVPLECSMGDAISSLTELYDHFFSAPTTLKYLNMT